MLWRPVTSWRCRAILLFVRSPCMCLPCLYTPELLASHVYSHLWEWFLIRYWKYQVTKWAIKTPKKNELYLVRKLGSLEEWWHSWRVWNESHPKLSITFVAYIQKMEADEQLRGRMQTHRPASRSHLWSAKNLLHTSILLVGARFHKCLKNSKHHWQVCNPLLQTHNHDDCNLTENASNPNLLILYHTSFIFVGCFPKNEHKIIPSCTTLGWSTAIL